MKVRIARDTLTNELFKVQGVTNQKSTLLILNNALLEARERTRAGGADRGRQRAEHRRHDGDEHQETHHPPVEGHLRGGPEGEHRQAGEWPAQPEGEPEPEERAGRGEDPPFGEHLAHQAETAGAQ